MSGAHSSRRAIVTVLCLAVTPNAVVAQSSDPPRLRATALAGNFKIDGIECDDPEPSKIVSYSVRRDAPLNSEDHVRIVLGPFRDGRSGYVFAVNPTGARYDGLINPGAESDNPDWDGIWDAHTARTTSGWSAEVWIPSRR